VSQLTTTDPPPLTIVQPGEGSSGTLGSIGVDFKLWANRYRRRSLRGGRHGAHASRDAPAVTAPSAQHALVHLERRQMAKEISDLEAWAWAGRWQADACRESG